MSWAEPDVNAISGHGISCRELVAVVSDYLEGVLPNEQRVLFETHIELCAGCRRHLDQIRITVKTTGRLREQDLPVVARDRLLAAFRSWKPVGL